MIQSEQIVEVLRSLLPEGEIIAEDSVSIDFRFPVGSSSLKAWAYIIGEENIIIQIYCTGSTDSEHLNSVRQFIAELNYRIPFGSYQTSDLGVITYRTQCFVETIEHAAFSINKALEWAGISIEEHISGISAVSGGFTTPEAAIELLVSKAAAKSLEESAPKRGTS